MKSKTARKSKMVLKIEITKDSKIVTNSEIMIRTKL